VPELPEVETIRSLLEPVLVGRRIEHARILDPRLTRPEPPETVADALVGEQIAQVGRRGKYLVIGFEGGRSLLVHLRMTGSLRHERDGSWEGDPYRRAVVRLDDNSQLDYRDVRRFGTWLLLEPGALDLYLAGRVGIEPLGGGFTAALLATALAGRRTSVKAALLDQRVVAGVGNIYADEALWRARLHPLRAAGSLTEEEIVRLHRGVRTALRAGIERQGATLRDYRRPDGAPGGMQEEFKVYGREGAPCPRCGEPIAKLRVAGRGTWLCPACQRQRS
jgi:formamidopyrimidine-DNA glycosylase